MSITYPLSFPPHHQKSPTNPLGHILHWLLSDTGNKKGFNLMGYGQENSGQIYPCFFGNKRMKKIKGEKD
jgi:hypothetical protein